MAEKDLRKWSTFFHEAGVPTGPAKEYATLFCDHRIKEVLLGDLTKDILNDIGITVMGDVMSILKHAKAVYAKLEREKSSNQLVQNSEAVVVLAKKDAPAQALQSSTEIKKKKVVSKLLNKPKTAVQQTEVLTLPTRKKLAAAEPKITMTVDDSVIVPKRPARNTMTLSERFASETLPPPKVSRISVEGSEAETSAVKKFPSKTQSPRRLTSSNKGVLASAQVKRKSAFERLGKEESSSFSKDMERLSPRIKITKLTKSPVTAPSSKVISLTKPKNESSVFKRLGESDVQVVASTTRAGALTIRAVRGLGSRIVSDDTPEKPVKSHNALRPLKPIRAVQPVKPVSSVKARVSVDEKKESNRKSVFSRLGSPT